MAAKTASGGGEVKKVLSAVNDHYGCVIVHAPEHMEPTTFLSSLTSSIFVSSLTSSIAHWMLQGKKGVWIKLPIERINLVEAVVKITYDILGRSELQEGFWYHHAEPDYLMLLYWIPKSPHTLPTNASFVLVVQEKGGQYRGTGVWKLPTGVVDEIDSEFAEVLTFRVSHKSFFEKSDLFFLCMLRPLSFDIQKQEQEIEAAKWMPYEEFAAQPFVQKYELLKYMHDICKAKIVASIRDFLLYPPEAILFKRATCT